MITSWIIVGMIGSAVLDTLPEPVPPILSKVQVAPAPEWVDVVKVSPTETLPAGLGRSSYLVLLGDEQIHLGTRERYVREVGLIRLSGAVETHSEIKVGMNPAREELVVHSIAIIRGGERLEILDPAKFKMVHSAASGAEGKVSVVHPLEGLQLGDLIDASYSLRPMGSRPTEKFADAIVLGAEWPSVRLRKRLIEAPGQSISYRLGTGAREPEITESGGLRVLAWNYGPLDPGQATGDLPRIELTEYPDWRAVATRAVAFFDVRDPEADAVGRVTDSIVRNHPILEDQVTAAIRFVQGQIREEGPYGNVMNQAIEPPSVVLQRRSGSRGGKALLLRTMLRRMGAAAHLVLGRARQPTEVAQPLPSASIFDRVFVRIILGDATVMIDPCLPSQGGGVRTMYFPPQGHGLILDGRTEPYGPLGADNSGLPLTVIRESIHVPGLQGETRLEMEIEHKNHAADQMRHLLRVHGQVKFTEAFLQRLHTAYPGIRQEGEMRLEDDMERNVLVIRGGFIIPELWRWDQRSRTWSATFFAHETAAMTGRHAGTLCEFSFPSKVTHTTRIHGIGGMVRPPRADEVRHEEFNLRSSGRVEGDVLVLNYEFDDRGRSRNDNESPSARESALLSSRLLFTSRVSAAGAASKKIKPTPARKPEPVPQRRY